jgi:hypothetical protein
MVWLTGVMLCATARHLSDNGIVITDHHSRAVFLDYSENYDGKQQE